MANETFVKLQKGDETGYVEIQKADDTGYGDTPFTYFRRLRTEKNSRLQFSASVAKLTWPDRRG